ncbi:uncharacterized protein [Acropora muricata]|uniref:uncharacterized protein isoform X3 n=1 Tax=Acropora muricata TaxID=159855 RepID=UPI0034E5533F
MGDVSDEEKLKVALMNCSIGAATPGGSLTVVQNAVRILRPKAVFSVGTCISLGLEKARIGDVVISSRLTTTEGSKTPGSPLLGNLARDAPYGWEAPLKQPDEWEIKVHCNGDILSQSLRDKCQYDDICEQYPKAIAIETEGEENHEKRPIHPLGTATPKKQRQNAAFPESDSDISKVVELLKIEYNRRADFSPLLWSKCMKLQLQEVYTKLRLVSEGEAESSGIDVDDIFGPCEKDNAWSIGPCGGKSRNWQNHLVSQTLSRLGEWCNGS